MAKIPFDIDDLDNEDDQSTDMAKRTAEKPSLSPKNNANNTSSVEIVQTVHTIKTIRDGFSMPEPEYELFAEIEKRALENGVASGKSQIIRAGLASMSKMPDNKLIELLKKVPITKPGRKRQ